MVDSSETYCDDFYLDSVKKSTRSKQLSVRNPANLEKARSNILLKVRQLPITRQSAEILCKLVVNHKITDIIKVIKIGKTSVTIHAKVNVESKVFEKLKNDDNVVIKVFYEAANASNEIFAYSRNIHNEEKEPPTTQWPSLMERDQNYLCEKMILFQMQNIVIMKMFNKSKSLSQMIKDNHSKVTEMYREILNLIYDLKNRDYLFWLNDMCGVKNIVWCNEKWILLSTRKVDENHQARGYTAKGLIEIINLFYHHEMKLDLLEKEFKNVFGKGSLWTLNGEIYLKVMEDFFNRIHESNNLPRKYIKAKFCKHLKPQKKSKKVN